MGLDDLITEARSAETRDLDLRSTEELVEVMNRQDAAVPAAVASSAADIAAVIETVVDRLQAGGRLVYVGAGSSGRLAAVDASECESTFSAAPGQVVALLAGADAPSPFEQEAAEDDAEAGRRDVHALGVGATDAVLGISASGRTPYVVGAMEAAAAAGAATACLVCAPGSQLAGLVEREIAVVVGPELLAGSTRLKAGTAQKLVLNMISTISMVRLGKTFDNLMVDVHTSNEKLRARARRIVMTATGASSEQADEALAAADGSAKVAIVMLLAGVDVGAARSRLAAAGGNIRQALES
ncbi:MAG TPA: N-acetylmuramic acid 6-phosphate etherase [Gaiellaceae bacterium]|nr:N-acetylmuramic acid 6-phosphate etherase [Gaiellaceae bacterium]